MIFTHAIALGAGFAMGIYALPILTAPQGPSAAEVQSESPKYQGQFRRELKDSDPLHWGDGKVLVSSKRIALLGEISPGPDYKLYLAPEFVETEEHFKRLKPSMTRVGDVKTFKNFAVEVPGTMDIERFNTVIVWCETFSQFITAAKYK